MKEEEEGEASERTRRRSGEKTSKQKRATTTTSRGSTKIPLTRPNYYFSLAAAEAKVSQPPGLEAAHKPAGRRWRPVFVFESPLCRRLGPMQWRPRRRSIINNSGDGEQLPAASQLKPNARALQTKEQTEQFLQRVRRFSSTQRSRSLSSQPASQPAAQLPIPEVVYGSRFRGLLFLCNTRPSWALDTWNHHQEANARKSVKRARRWFPLLEANWWRRSSGGPGRRNMAARERQLACRPLGSSSKPFMEPTGQKARQHRARSWRH